MSESKGIGGFDPRVEVQSLLAAIVENSDDAIISNHLDGTVTSWNRAAERMFGYAADEMIGRPIFILAAPDRPDEMPELLDRIRRGEKVDHYETVRRTRRGTMIDVSLTVSPIRDSGGNVVGSSKIARDITERKAVEKEIALTTQKLARSNADLQQFAYVASHDLQEPLRSISAFSELLKRRYRGRLDSDADDFIGNVVAAAERMSAMIRDLLEYSSLGDSSEPADMGAIDTREPFEWALRNLQLAVAESGARVAAGNLPVVRGDPTAIVQLLQNLIGNAVKYRRPGVPVQVGVNAERQGEYWLFSVADNGIGIDPRYHERIFGLFKRLHGPQYPGTGIGLSLCRKIVEKHGGRIWVESTLGNGATFYFTLPVE